MSSSEPELPDTPEERAHEQQSVQRGGSGKWLLLAVMVTVVVVALVVGLLARTSVLTTSSPASPSVVPANWQMFHDQLGLYTLRLPPGWKVYYGFTSIATVYHREAHANWPQEQFAFTSVSPALRGEELTIFTLPITNTAQAHKLFCPQDPQDVNATFHGLPAQHTLHGPPSSEAGYSWGFSTGNALFSIFVSFQSQSDALLAPTSTPLSATLFATEQADANGILASLQPSDTKPLVC